MEDEKKPVKSGSPCIDHVVGAVVRRLDPQLVYLYSQKKHPGGGVTGFKLCVVLDNMDKRTAEIEVYRNIDCDIPFDVLIYTMQEWKDLTVWEGSFASKIQQTGLIVYG